MSEQSGVRLPVHIYRVLAYREGGNLFTTVEPHQPRIVIHGVAESDLRNPLLTLPPSATAHFTQYDLAPGLYCVNTGTEFGDAAEANNRYFICFSDGTSVEVTKEQARLLGEMSWRGNLETHEDE